MSDQYADLGVSDGSIWRAALARLLGEYLKADQLLSDREDVCAFECDGLSAYRSLPWFVAIPETLQQVQAVLRICRDYRVPVVVRGAGTGLSGGALPHAKGLLLCMTRFNRILQIDPVNRTARVQPGVRNLAVSEAANSYGL